MCKWRKFSNLREIHFFCQNRLLSKLFIKRKKYAQKLFFYFSSTHWQKRIYKFGRTICEPWFNHDKAFAHILLPILQNLCLHRLYNFTPVKFWKYIQEKMSPSFYMLLHILFIPEEYLMQLMCKGREEQCQSHHQPADNGRQSCWFSPTQYEGNNYFFIVVDPY